MPANADFLPLDSACEEHICPWTFAESGHDLGPSNVQLKNANGLSTLPARKVMVSYDVLGGVARSDCFRAERRQEAPSQCGKAHEEWR